MWMLRTTPPRPRVLLKRRPTSVPRKRQLDTLMFSTPPLISDPTVKPPWPWKTVQLSTMRFLHGRARRRPSASLPDLMQMPSSPASKMESMIRTFSQLSTSMASPFWEYQGLRMLTRLTMRFLHMSGWTFQQGEFWKVTPSSRTFSQLRSWTRLGRRKLLISFHSASVRSLLGTFMLLIREALRKPSSGYQVLPSSLRTPPEASRRFHSPSAILLFLTMRQASPLPSITPEPVMEMFFAPSAWIGDSQRLVSRPSKTVLTMG